MQSHGPTINRPRGPVRFVIYKISEIESVNRNVPSEIRDGVLAEKILYRRKRYNQYLYNGCKYFGSVQFNT